MVVSGGHKCWGCKTCYSIATCQRTATSTISIETVVGTTCRWRDAAGISFTNGSRSRNSRSSRQWIYGYCYCSSSIALTTCSANRGNTKGCVVRKYRRGKAGHSITTCQRTATCTVCIETVVSTTCRWSNGAGITCTNCCGSRNSRSGRYWINRHRHCSSGIALTTRSAYRGNIIGCVVRKYRRGKAGYSITTCQRTSTSAVCIETVVGTTCRWSNGAGITCTNCCRSRNSRSGRYWINRHRHCSSSIALTSRSAYRGNIIGCVVRKHRRCKAGHSITTCQRTATYTVCIKAVVRTTCCWCDDSNTITT